jgi:hypothetical protein
MEHVVRCRPAEPSAASRVALGAAVLGLVVGGCLNLMFPYSPENLFETRVRAACAFAFRCCQASERSFTNLEGFRDEESCITELLRGNDFVQREANLGQRAQEVIASGNGEFDDELAERCTKPLIDASYACDAQAVLAPGAADPDCVLGARRAFVIGKLDDGDDCTDSLECADDGECIRDADEAVEVSLAGRCRARAGRGDDCADRECQTGLFCSFDEDGSQRCAERPLLDDGEPCGIDEECASGFCTATETGACEFTGEPCNDDADCDSPADTCVLDFSQSCGDDGPKVDVCNGR